jgi:hypothetical protein
MERLRSPAGDAYVLFGRGQPAHGRQRTGLRSSDHWSARRIPSLERDRDALPRHRQASPRRQAGLGRNQVEGTQNLLCAYLAAAVLVGLLGNALLDLWWLDPTAALVVAAVAVEEGRESRRGEGCCATC